MAESDEIAHGKKRGFLAAYARTASITRAAELADIVRSTHYEWLRSDPDYAAAFATAKELAMDALEDEAVRRAHQGTGKPVVYQGQFSYEPMADPATGEILRDEKGNIRYTNRPLVINEYSDTLMIVLLKGGRPDKYRDNFNHDVTHKGGITVNVTEVESRL